MMERPPPAASASVEDLVAYARHLYRMRRKRDALFPGLFADPAWDMMLDLFVAYVEGRQTCVSSVCIAAAVPPTTGLRWITKLVEEGVFERHEDALDRRRTYVALSSKAFQKLSLLLEGSIDTSPRSTR